MVVGALVGVLMSIAPADGREPAQQRCPDAAGGYTATVLQRAAGPASGPVLSRGTNTSTLEFAFNTAWFPGNGEEVGEGLVVRVQDNEKFPWWGVTGAVAVVPLRVDSSSTANESSVVVESVVLRAGRLTSNSIVWPGVAPPPKLPPSVCPPGSAACHASLWGAIDPRISYRAATKTYYLGWDNCSQFCTYRQTQLSTTTNPLDPSLWVHHGPVLGDTNSWRDQTGSHQASTAGAAFLFREGDKAGHLAIVATGSLRFPQWEQVLMLARSTDTLRWNTITCTVTQDNRCCNDTSVAAREPSSTAPCKDVNCCSPTPVCADVDAGRCQDAGAATAGVGRTVLVAPRPGCWDHGGICAGPPPLPLSNGHLLYVYNHDSHDGKNSTSGRCAPGWVILDRDDPTKVIARASEPLISGCNCSGVPPGQGSGCLGCGEPWDVEGQTPEVVFVDGLRPLGNDVFVVTYGAADTVVGAAVFKIHVPLKSD